MMEDSKLAPIISFNNHFKNDPYGDEELLVVSTPDKKLETSERRRSTVDKGCMTDDNNTTTTTTNNNNNNTLKNNTHTICNNNQTLFIMPNNLAINFTENGMPQITIERTSPLNALIIGEIPLNINQQLLNATSSSTKRLKNQESLTSESQNEQKQQLVSCLIEQSFSSSMPSTTTTTVQAAIEPIIQQARELTIVSPVTVKSSSSKASSLKSQIIPYLLMPFKKRRPKNENEEHKLKEMEIKENLETNTKLANTLITNELNDSKLDECLIDADKASSKVENNNNNSGEATNVLDVPVVREQWDRKIEFLLAIIGFSVDLGNIWRFPKVVYENGGGRFLIPYFVQLALCGLPLFYMELALGQFHQTGLFTLWEKLCPILKGLAFTTLIINLFMAMFYNTVIGWAVYYLALSIRPVLPWKGCDNPWNTLCCFPINDHKKISKVENFTFNSNNYQKKSDNGLIYRIQNDDNVKRLIIFNTKLKKTDTLNMTSFFTAISEFFSNPNLKFPDLNALHKNVTLSNTDSIAESKINKWIKSYYLIVNNELKEAPIPYLSNLEKFAHDPGLLTNEIEKKIQDLYPNKSAEIILNCAELLNNPTQEFYTRYLTEMHKSTGLEDLGSLKWQMILCLLVVFITVYFALWKGIKSAGKAVWITAIAPYVVMFILLIRGLTLEGSWIGIEFYLRIDNWQSLIEIKVWIDAAAQIFFSLGPGFGTIIALSSYNKKTNDCYKDALLTSFINCFTSILSGFVVFSTLGHMAHVQGKTIQEVTEPGPGLIFITYPQAISMMPGAPLWAVIFFFMLFTLGIDSTFGGLESVITAICDNYPTKIGKNRSLLVLGLVVLCFLGALPTVTYGGPYIVHLFDSFTVAPSILFVALLETIGVMYAYGCDRFCDDLYSMIKIKPNFFWIICWKYISPLIILVMTIMICSAMVSEPLSYGDDYKYIGLGEYLGGFIVAVPLSMIFIYAFYRIYITKGTLKERILLVIRPKDQWPIIPKETQSIENGSTNLKIAKIQQSKYIKINFIDSPREPVNL